MSQVRFFNNTKYQTLEPKFIWEGVSHLLCAVDSSVISDLESIELNDKELNLICHEDEDNRALTVCIKLNRDVPVVGVVRWFDESSGEGVIRLEKSRRSVHFYACNVVGANSHYPHLVTNVSLKEGDKVRARVSIDPYMFREIGLIKVERILGGENE